MNSTDSNVLLLIIPNPSSTILPHSTFYKLFSDYGDVHKILIFEKARVWKAFIEMGNPAQAKNAQINLNGVEVSEGITMNVYFSALKSVTFLNNNCGGVDYSQMRNKNEEKKKLQLQLDNQYWYSQPEIANKCQNVYDNPMFHSVQTLNLNDSRYKMGTSQLSESWLTPRNGSEKTAMYKQPLMRKTSIENIWADAAHQAQSPFEDYNVIPHPTVRLNKIHEEDMIRSESSEYYLNAVNKMTHDYGYFRRNSSDEDPKHSEEEQMKHHEGLSPDEQNIMNAFQSDYVYGEECSKVTRKFHRSLTHNLQHEMTTQLDAMQLTDFKMMVPPNLNSNSQPTTMTKIIDDIIDPNNYVNPQFLIENQPSKVIYIRGLQHPSLSPVNIFNLLSNCGNVMVIIYIKQKSSVLVQFEKLQQAQNAKDHLNNMPFFGQKLKIFYSNYQQIQFPLPYQSPQTMVYIPNKDQFRFGEGKSISFNPPSQTLHLSNIKVDVTHNEKYLRELFSGIGNVQAIKFMHLNEQKHMALVKLETVEEAMNGAALLHGRDLFGRKLNVSFTKSKL